MVTGLWVIAGLLVFVILLRSLMFFAWRDAFRDKTPNYLENIDSFTLDIPNADVEVTSTGIVPGGVSFIPASQSRGLRYKR